jgi:hypothetical protein
MPTPGSVAHQHILITLEIAQQLPDVPLEPSSADHAAHMLALCPASHGRLNRISHYAGFDWNRNIKMAPP